MQVMPIEPSTTCAGSCPVAMKNAAQHVGVVGVEAQRAGGDRAQEVLAVLHLDEAAGVGLQDVVEDRGVEEDLGVDALAAPLLEVDVGRLLVHAVVARQADAGHAGRRLDQLVDHPVAGDGRHVHAHGVAGVEAEAEEDRGAEGVGAHVEQLAGSGWSTR